MRAVAKLLRFEHPAKNRKRQVIKRKPVKAYLESEACASKLRNKTIFGGITHILRHGPQGPLGTNDKMLLEGPILLRVDNLWIEGDYLMGELTIFDDISLYEGDHRAIVSNILKLLRTGSKIGVSSVIQARWYNDNTLAELVSFNGVDFTLAPSFDGCELVGEVE